MKKYLLALLALSLSYSSSFANEDEYVDEAVDLQELSDRMNIIKADQYIEMVSPAQDYAHETAKKLTDKEAKMYLQGANFIQKRLSKRLNTQPPAPIDTDTIDTQTIEELLTPEMYTFDNLEQTNEPTE